MLHLLVQDELQDLRDEHAQLLSCSGGGAAGESLSLMYGNLLRKYEARRDECDKLLVARNEAANQAEAVQEQLKQYKSSFENMVNERNKYKQQCTQVYPYPFFLYISQIFSIYFHKYFLSF